MSKETVEWDYCPNCNKHVITFAECYSCVGQYGMNVYAKEICTECEHVIRTKLIDKDI